MNKIQCMYSVRVTERAVYPCNVLYVHTRGRACTHDDDESITFFSGAVKRGAPDQLWRGKNASRARNDKENKILLITRPPLGAIRDNPIGGRYWFFFPERAFSPSPRSRRDVLAAARSVVSSRRPRRRGVPTPPARLGHGNTTRKNIIMDALPLPPTPPPPAYCCYIIMSSTRDRYRVLETRRRHGWTAYTQRSGHYPLP